VSTRSEVLLWAQRVLAKKAGPPHTLLEVAAHATAADAQEAFHKLARMAHPDLHRNALTPDELEVVTNAYAAVAGAYQTFRGQVTGQARSKPITSEQKPATPSGPAPAGNASSQMSPKALVYYRKAEMALRRGDLKGALLQLKMAIASDPQSVLLRSALGEVEAELKKS